MRKATATCCLFAISCAIGAAPSYAAISSDWVAGRDLRNNELSATELSNANGQVPEWRYGFLDPPAGAFTLFAVGDHSNTLSPAGNLEGYFNQASLAVNATNAPIIVNSFHP